MFKFESKLQVHEGLHSPIDRYKHVWISPLLSLPFISKQSSFQTYFLVTLNCFLQENLCFIVKILFHPFLGTWYLKYFLFTTWFTVCTCTKNQKLLLLKVFDFGHAHISAPSLRPFPRHLVAPSKDKSDFDH